MRLLLVGLLPVMVAAWGCASPTPTPTATPTPTPPSAVAIYAQAAQAMGGLSSYRAAGVIHQQGTAEPLQVVYDLQFPDRFLLSFEGTSDGQPFQAGAVFIGADLYLSPAESTDWFVVPLELRAGLPFAVLDVGSIFRQFATGVGDLAYVSKDDIDGMAVHRVRGALPQGMWALFHPGEEVPTPEPTGASEAWIGVDDSLVHRLDFTLGSDSVTLNVSDFNQVTVSAPPNPRPGNELLALIGPPTGGLSPGLPQTPEEVRAFIQALPQPVQDCAREGMGDEAFDELLAGARMPTFDEIGKAFACMAAPSY